mmetsp:Transcript_95574/g.270413  ORF Transcript_95574/g.270413 Transcript_95574/m.270413 type:complete len:227 (-) Transcript_95574:396-1076(-)
MAAWLVLRKREVNAWKAALRLFKSVFVAVNFALAARSFARRASSADLVAFSCVCCSSKVVCSFTFALYCVSNASLISVSLEFCSPARSFNDELNASSKLAGSSFWCGFDWRSTCNCNIERSRFPPTSFRRASWSRASPNALSCADSSASTPTSGAKLSSEVAFSNVLFANSWAMAVEEIAFLNLFLLSSFSSASLELCFRSIKFPFCVTLIAAAILALARRSLEFS